MLFLVVAVGACRDPAGGSPSLSEPPDASVAPVSPEAEPTGPDAEETLQLPSIRLPSVPAPETDRPVSMEGKRQG